MALPSYMTVAPIAYYKFESSGTLGIDERGAYSGTVNGSPTWGSNKDGFRFEGGYFQTGLAAGSASIRLPNISAVAGYNHRSFVFWLYPLAAGANNSAFVYGSGGQGAGGNGHDFDICYGRWNANNLAVHYWGGGAYTGTNTFPYANQWHCIVVTHNGTNQTRFFLDGVQIPTATQNTFLDTANQYFWIGNRGSNNTSETHANARIGAFRIYNQIIPDSEILAIYKFESDKPIPNYGETIMWL